VYRHSGWSRHTWSRCSPLSPAAYRDLITKPVAVYTRQVARLDLEPDLVEALVKGASGADALPLLAFTLQRLLLDYAPEQTDYDAIFGVNVKGLLFTAQKAFSRLHHFERIHCRQ
jgi:hypothetical protein